MQSIRDRAVEPGEVAHRERDVGNRRAIAHLILPPARSAGASSVDAHRGAFKPASASAFPVRERG
jgi:hypothetical protein